MKIPSKDLATKFNITFEEMLQELEMDHEQYELAIRSGLSHLTIFLKRKCCDIRTNQSCPLLSKGWCANTDVQPITDPYQCAQVKIPATF